MRTFSSGNWTMEFIPGDGARISSLRYNGHELFTSAPEDFSPPSTDYGSYETRPVYGYDDCFPTVDPCRFPGKDWDIPDHGELCLLSWKAEAKDNRVLFCVESEKLPISFKRIMTFINNRLEWDFEVNNNGKEELPVLHVMHPLMPLSKVRALSFPGFRAAFDDMNTKELNLSSSSEMEEFLLEKPEGTFEMLFLSGADKGSFSVGFESGLKLEVTYPVDLFPSIGVWWNNSGYPDEDGIRRDECAFEPSPGNTGSLKKLHEKGGMHLTVKPGQKLLWKIVWEAVT